ncbi:MAG: methyltransferase domain-containing protein [Rhodothermales bacterium]
MQTPDTILDDVRTYYGSVLQGTKDLRTTACCTTDSIPAHVRSVLAEIDDEILDRFYGCGSPIPPAIEGATVLDLGCGTGRDVYVASRLAGPSGRAIGIDMTEEQLDVARRHVDAHTDRFGYDEPNVSFRSGYIEDLRTAGIEDESVDVVISNCVINLSPDKRRVFQEIFRVLKPGGELYFSDVFADRRVPDEMSTDPVLRGECLGGAMYVEDFRRLLGELGCPDYRVVSSCAIEMEDGELAERVGNVGFTSQTIRAFKLPDSLEDICEDYGQIATYRGSIPEAPNAFDLDDHHRFETGRPVLVCGNTAAMLEETRYGRHFDLVGDRSIHFGAFDCGPSASPGPSGASGASGACNC